MLWSPVQLTTLELSYHLLKKIAFQPLKKVVLFMNFRADMKLLIWHESYSILALKVF